MAYTVENFPSKKALKRALLVGDIVTCYNPGLGPDLSNYSGTIYLEGPHHPALHTWYAKAVLEEGKVRSVA